MRAVLAVRPRKRRVRGVALLAAALVIAAALGVGVGTLIAPSGTAARGPVGLGFLPEPGWFALQSSAHATATSPATAMASNVPFHPDDDVQGSAESSALPYATLLSLPPHGVVIATTFTLRDRPALVGRFLSADDAALEAERRRQGEPVRPPGAAGGAARASQLPRLRERPQHRPPRLLRDSGSAALAPARGAAPARPTRRARSGSHGRAPGAPAASTPSAPLAISSENAVTVDHTLLCTTRTHGGIHEVEARAHAGYRVDGRWAKLPYAIVASGGAGGSLSGNQTVSTSALAWMTAGTPTSETTVDSEFETFPVRASGTLGYNRTRCKATSARVPLTRAGLQGGPTDALGEERDCETPSRVLVRIRARLETEGVAHEARRLPLHGRPDPRREAEHAHALGQAARVRGGVPVRQDAALRGASLREGLMRRSARSRRRGRTCGHRSRGYPRSRRRNDRTRAAGGHAEGGALLLRADEVP